MERGEHPLHFAGAPRCGMRLDDLTVDAVGDRRLLIADGVVVESGDQLSPAAASGDDDGGVHRCQSRRQSREIEGRRGDRAVRRYADRYDSASSGST